MRTARRIAFAAVVPLFFIWGVIAAELRAADRTARARPAHVTGVSVGQHNSAAVLPPEGDTAPPPAVESATDLYGNEVDDAVAEYSLDADGSPYEIHAPQVALPHLGPPKS